MNSNRDPLLNKKSIKTNVSKIKEYLSKKVENPWVRGFFSTVGGLGFGGGFTTTFDWLLKKITSDPEIYKNFTYANYAIGLVIAFGTTIAIFYKLRVDVNTVSEAAELKVITRVGLNELLTFEDQAEEQFKALKSQIDDQAEIINELKCILADSKHDSTITIGKVEVAPPVIPKLTRQGALSCLHHPRTRVQRRLMDKGLSEAAATQLTAPEQEDSKLVESDLSESINSTRAGLV